MRKQIIRFGIDKLKVCCTQEDNWLQQTIINAFNAPANQSALATSDLTKKPKLYIPISNDVTLVLNQDKEFIDRNTWCGSVELTCAGKTTTFLDEIEIHAHQKGDDYKDYTFLTMDNRWLYQEGWTDRLVYVMGLLRLRFHNFSTMEVHCTSVGLNFVDRINRKRREKGIVVVSLKKDYKGNERVDGLGKWLRQTAIGSDLSSPTLYIDTAKKDLRAKAYNKTVEMNEQNPNKIAYVKDWMHGYKGTLHRLEVTLTNPRIKPLLQAYYSNTQLSSLVASNTILNILEDDNLLRFLWLSAIHTLLHFKRGRKQQDWLEDVIRIDKCIVLTSNRSNTDNNLCNVRYITIPPDNV